MRRLALDGDLIAMRLMMMRSEGALGLHPMNYVSFSIPIRSGAFCDLTSPLNCVPTNSRDGILFTKVSNKLSLRRFHEIAKAFFNVFLKLF